MDHELPPRTMSTQHPDNVKQPFFAGNSILNHEDEIKEAFYAFSILNCQEQLFDYEGKDTDNSIVKRLLSRYPDYFRDNVMGRDKTISFRIPNASIEKTEAKLVIEILNSIPRYFDTAQRFYNDGTVPVSEVFVPMVTHSNDTVLVHEYYRKLVSGTQDQIIANNIKLSSWIGRFKPEQISVTPLVEDMQSMLIADKIAREHILATKEEQKRFWLARSDPALNYSSLGAVILNKIALQKLHFVEEELSVEIYPMIGCGSAPFRGNFKPSTVEQCMKGYPSIQTFTTQSSFKYDHEAHHVQEAIEKLNTGRRKTPTQIDEARTIQLLQKVSSKYKEHITQLAPMINKVARYVPSRRKRKLHIGLFGYSRSEGSLQLPRAIKFCASLYSMGIPPELLGLSELTSQEVDEIHTFYPHFKLDVQDALAYLNLDNVSKYYPHVAQDLRRTLVHFDVAINEKHKLLSTQVMHDLTREKTGELGESITQAARIRGFLG